MHKKALYLCTLALFVIPGLLVAQDDSTDAKALPNGAISGLIVDKDGRPLSGVLVTISTRGKEGSLVTQESGRFRFTGLDPETPFRLGFAKKEYLMDVRDSVVLQPGQELMLNLVLRKTKVKALKAITVVAAPPKGSSLSRKYIGAEELSNIKVPNLLEALQRLRPGMLVKHTPIGMCMDSVFSLYIDGVRRPVFDPEYSDIDSTQASFRQVPLSQIVFEKELEWFRPDEIAQVTYISCDDWVPGIPRRNLIWVVTKRAMAGAASFKELQQSEAEKIREAEQEAKMKKEEEEKAKEAEKAKQDSTKTQ